MSIVQRIAQRVSVGGAKGASRAIDIDAGDTGIIEAKPLPGQISALYPYIRPAVDQAGPDLDAAIKANAKIQATLLRQSSPVLAEHISTTSSKSLPAITIWPAAWSPCWIEVGRGSRHLPAELAHYARPPMS